jgi:hypothetical protein
MAGFIVLAGSLSLLWHILALSRRAYRAIGGKLRGIRRRWRPMGTQEMVTAFVDSYWSHAGKIKEAEERIKRWRREMDIEADLLLAEGFDVPGKPSDGGETAPCGMDGPARGQTPGQEEGGAYRRRWLEPSDN